VTYDEAPETFRVSLRQRLRWVSGVMDVADRSAAALISRLRERGRARRLDALMFLLTPYAQVVSAVSAALYFLSRAGEGGLTALAAPVLLGAVAGYAAMTLFAAALSLRMGRRCGITVKSVLLFPIFMASWLPLQLYASVHRVESWRPVCHGISGKMQKRSPVR
jgi:cellulose synthase/poly-beta-1,6-N-acetylglucosamine synthase-like glycosyltransferase